MGLGPAGTVTLAEAREKAKQARKQLVEGVDPIAKKRADKAAKAVEAAKTMTFRQCAEAYIAGNSAAWENAKHGAQWTASLKTYVYPKIGALPVAAIDTGLVLSCIEPIWTTKTETASRVRGRIEMVLDWAGVRKYRAGDNPARWDGHLQHVLPAKGDIAKPVNQPALAYDKLPAFMATLHQHEGVPARALEFTILTAARTGAVLGATWSEIDFNDKVWNVPASRAGTKTDKPRRIPLSDRAIELLRALPTEKDNPHVFIGGKAGGGLWDMAMSELLKAMAAPSSTPGRLATVHGFRSTFKDWVSETTSYPNFVSEAALWHTIADKVEAAYRRGDLFNKRRRLMAEWATYCRSVSARTTSTDAKVVVPIRGQAS
jgi:integrase